ncbi:Superkiller protein 3 [Rhizophlyctis rosea]|uniref:Superkiller protein 3 n=1 Tax=Rhizophlyctis rosea TaxID=64517 RepID=A0AAD5SK19_9FUNG|nr:Superkiller protein 3 [Rhizophlyctis rosea]
MSAKALLKSAREAIGAKNFSQAQEYCQQILESDESNYNALVFLGVAEEKLNNAAASEKAYRKAVEANPTSVLAYQGLASLFEKVENPNALAETWEKLRELHLEGKDGKKCLDTTQKLIDLYERTNQRRKAIDTLHALLPDSGYVEVLTGLDLPPPIETYWRIARLQEKEDEVFATREVQNRRQRLGADPLDVIKAKVEKEVVLTSQLDEVYNKIVELERERGTDVTEVTSKLLVFLQRKLPHVAPERKDELRNKLRTRAEECVSQNLQIPLAYEILLECQNVDAHGYDLSLLTSARDLGESNYIGLLASGYLKWKDGSDLNDILEDLIAGVDTNPSTLFGYHVLAAVYVQHEEYESGVDCANKARSNAFQRSEAFGEVLDRVLLSIDLNLARANLHLGPKNLQTSLGIYKNILSQDSSNLTALQGLGLALAQSDKYDESIRCFEKVLRLDPASHSAKAHMGWVQFQRGQHEEALEWLKQAVEAKQEAVYVYRIGRVYWAMGGQYRTDKTYAQTNLLQAAKLNPRFGPAFTYMGHYYAEVENDRVRALKCYQRAVSLSVTDEEAAKALSRMYLENKDAGSAKAVLTRFVGASPRAVWAYRQLGTVALVEGEYMEAISNFQALLRIDTKDLLSWEGLGEAYGHEGKFQAALKAFARAIELDESSVFAHYSVAQLKLKLGLYAEAAEGFRQTNALASKRNEGKVHMPSVKALLDSLIALAKECYLKGAYGECLGCLGEAVRVGVGAKEFARGMQSFVKVLGDVCIAYRLFVPALVGGVEMGVVEAFGTWVENEIQRFGMRRIESGVEDLPGNGAEAGLDKILKVAVDAYQLAIGLCSAAGTKEAKDLAAAYWHDLGLAFFYRWDLRSGKGGEGKGNQLLALAVRSARVALGTHSGNDVFWNALGVYTLGSDPKISQHAFIRAIECNSRNPAPWSNLGFLYLINGDLDLANQAFGKSQFVDPDWSVAWLGQAYIAEKLGSSEAFELYEHAHELGGESEFEINYSYAVQRYRRALSHGHRDAALYSTATFCLLKFIERRKDDAAALNLLGLVLERQGQFLRAVEAFNDSLHALESPLHATSIEHPSKLRKVLENLARSLCAAGRYNESASTYARLAELGGSDALASVGAGIALYFDGRLQESLAAFEVALRDVEGGEKEGKDGGGNGGHGKEASLGRRMSVDVFKDKEGKREGSEVRREGTSRERSANRRSLEVKKV